MAMSNCCTCFPKQLHNPNPCHKASKPCPGNCLYFPKLLVVGEDSLAPCGETKLISFDEIDKEFDLCDGAALEYYVLSHSDNIKVNSISDAGIEITSISPGENFTAKVEFSVGCGNYSLITSVNIILNNPCLGKVVPPYHTCDKCTGDIVAIPNEISIGGNGKDLQIKK